jgi:hypothetical protein
VTRSLCPSLTALATLVLSFALFAPAGAQQAQAKQYALLVGIKEYKGATFSELKYSERDVEELAPILTASGYEVRLLTTSAGKKDKKDVPTAANVRKAFADMIKGKGKGDTVLLALSGHGVQLDVKDPDGKEEPKSYGYFCPSDADVTDVKYSNGHSDHLILVSDLFEGMGKCQATHKLVLMDACRNEETVKAASRNVNVEVTRVPRGVAALFSCSRNQRAWEHDELKHGVFFHYVLKGLRGEAKNEDREVTWDALSAYVKKQVRLTVPKLIKSGAKQTPHGIGSLEDDPLLLVVAVVPVHLHRLTLKYRKAGEREFSDEQLYNVECFRDPDAGHGLYLSQTGGLCVLPKGQFKTGTKDTTPATQHGFDMEVRAADEKAKKPKFGVECSLDESGNLIYVSHTGSVSVVPARYATVNKDKAKNYTLNNGMNAKVRKAGSRDFDDAGTKTYGIDVYVDENNQNVLYLSETGSIAVVPSILEARDGEKKISWHYGSDLNVRPAKQEAGKTFGLEVYKFGPHGSMLYVLENGSIAVVPGKLADFGDGKKGTTWRRGFDLLARTPKEVERTNKTAIHGFEVFRDENNGNLIYVNDKGHLAVVAAVK